MNKIILYFIGIVSIFAIILISFTDAQAQEISARMLIPLYMYPSENVWGNVVNANTNKNIDVIINPSNGSGTSQKVAFVNGINQLRAGNVGVFGYVITNYGSRSLASVKNEIDNYYAWYHVDGIFLDEASNTTSDISYYSDLWFYITAKGMKVILNPGANTKEDYASISNSIVIYESVVPKTLSVSAWIMNYSSSKFAALQYGANAEQMRNFVAQAKINNVGYIYVTNDIEPNPWDELPPYLAEEAALLWGQSVISGTTGVSGVVLSYTDGTAKSVTTDANGNYSITVPNGWSGTVTPTHTCYTFSPASYAYTNVTTVQSSQNYTSTFVIANGCAN
ncbi:MAG: spherulation-specific family 4 protein, partial [Anaerolineales bacterium]